jgi:polyisoprenoid-binding protein YceI
MSKTWKIVVPVVVVLLLVVGGGLWWFLRDDAPSEVSLDSAVESVTTTTGAGGETSAVTDASGTWVIDTSTGSFDFESATGTFAGFRIEEELSSIGSTTAVGRTGDVTGSITIEGDSLTTASFEVDLTSVTTNESQRDNRVQSALDTDSFPTATFTLTEPVSLGADPTSGEEISVVATGEFTLHGVTKAVEVPLQAKLVGDTVVVVGSFDVTFSDYDVEVPAAPIVLSVSDQGTIEMQLLFTKE